MISRTTAAAILAFFIAGLVVGDSKATQQLGAGATVPAEQQLLTDILIELRRINNSVRQTTLLSNKTQIALSLIQAQQTQVDRINRQLQSARTEIESGALQRAEMEERLKLLSTQLEGESDIGRHTQLEDESRALKALVSTHEQHQQHLRDEESRLAAQLQSEQDKLERLMADLTSLKHAMNSQLGADGS